MPLTFAGSRRTLGCQNTSSPASIGYDILKPSPRVPLEIIDNIIEKLLYPSANDSDETRRFASIASFSLASVGFREMALRRFFYRVHLTSRDQWAGALKLMQALEGRPYAMTQNNGFSWIRELNTSSVVISHKKSRLNSLLKLQMLSIDLVHEGLSTQHPRIKGLFYNLGSGIYPTLASLTLSSLPRIDAVLLGLIANKFPRLTHLSLSSTERIQFDCCWACFEDSLSCTLHSPIPDDYFDLTAMATAFSAALRPLEYLSDLHLGLFLSDDQLLSMHVLHSLVGGDGDSFCDVANWIKCQPCIGKDAEDVHGRELEGATIMGRILPSLKMVSWNSLFAGAKGLHHTERHANSDDTVEDSPGNLHGDTDDDDDVLAREQFKASNLSSSPDDGMKTTFWISRSQGQVRARRLF